MINYNYNLPLAAVGAHVRNASLSSAVVITTPTGASGILIQALVMNARYTLDSTTPTAAIGFQLRASDPVLFLSLTPGQTIRVIQEMATAEVQYQFVAQ